jgi:hypothetical protein
MQIRHRFDLTRVLPVFASLALAACQSGEVLGPAATLSGGGDGTSDGQGDGDGDPGEGGTGPLLDMADDTGMGTGSTDGVGETPCARVDLLFVIDNSSSMRGEQEALIASFPGFIDGIQTTLAEVFDYHVGVVTTDEYEGNSFFCQSLGALVTGTTGQYSSNATCGPYADGYNFMTESDNLASKFACAAKVGVDGALAEKPMAAMLRAVSPGLSAVGACNEGFIRSDALLIVVVITDEEDTEGGNFPGSPGGPQQWFDQLVAYKGGVESNIVVITIAGFPAPNLCTTDTAEHAARLLAFTDLFTYGYKGDVCTPSYSAYFNQAIGVIANACEQFTPVG